MIKGHLSTKRPFPGGATGSRQYEVFARSWQQEFEADSVGLELMIQVLLGAAAENPGAFAYFIYALKAPLFFFDCLEMLDRAKVMQRSETMSPQMTENDKASSRRCADGTMREPDKDWCANRMLDTHPPPWLRRDRLNKFFDHSLV